MALGRTQVWEGGGLRIHSYTAPAQGWLVNSHIVEGPERLVLFDAQLLEACAVEVADYATQLGKPVDRIIVSHAHPDHFAGLGVLTDRFPSAAVCALSAVAAAIATLGPTMLAALRKGFGDAVSDRVVVPDRAIEPGRTTIAGIAFDFAAVSDAESGLQLVALLPEARVLIAFDLVFSPDEHVFTTVDHFAHWIETLAALEARDDFDTILIGHGGPVGRAAIPATIAYLERAAAIHDEAADGATYAAALKAAFPERGQPGWTDFSGRLLYAPRPG